jgi:lysophospholipase L1-like esterase
MNRRTLTLTASALSVSALVLALATVSAFNRTAALAGSTGTPQTGPATIASVSPASESVASVPASPSSLTSQASPSPSPSPVTPLPSLLGAIGDSYSQAYSVSPKLLRDHPAHSWVVGTATGDGVDSLVERFEALGATPRVVDAATSGRKMKDATRQANAIAAAAAKLKPGQTAYVTFELGTNDLCDDPKTDLASYRAQLDTSMSILADSLPTGSRILMLSVPDFRHLREITQADSTARATLAKFENSRRCAPFLGDDSPATLSEAGHILDGYNASLKSACDLIERSGRLACTYSEARLSARDFLIADLSTVDYFHPSLTGQAKLADAAWAADIWAALPLPDR